MKASPNTSSSRKSRGGEWHRTTPVRFLHFLAHLLLCASQENPATSAQDIPCASEPLRNIRSDLNQGSLRGVLPLAVQVATLIAPPEIRGRRHFHFARICDCALDGLRRIERIQLGGCVPTRAVINAPRWLSSGRRETWPRQALARGRSPCTLTISVIDENQRSAGSEPTEPCS
jgi:hypothetical protein